MKKRALFVFALLFLAVNSYAHEVYVAYVADKACGTNLVFNVEDGTGFQFYGTIPNGYDLSSFKYVGEPPQVKRVCKTLFVGINDYLPSRQLNSLTTYQMNFLRAINDGQHDQWTSQEVMSKYNLGTKSNISKMQNLLLEKDFIERREDGLYLSDPVLQLWLKQY